MRHQDVARGFQGSVAGSNQGMVASGLVVVETRMSLCCLLEKCSL